VVVGALDVGLGGGFWDVEDGVEGGSSSGMKREF
jgi:hypothetical protein